MPRFFARIILLAIFIGSVALAANTTLRVEIKGMTCPACADKVKTQLSKIAWIEEVTINLDDSYAAIIVKSGRSSNTEDIRQAIQAAGFHVKGITTQ